MKKSGIIRLAIFIIAIVSLSACCGLKKLTKFQSDIKYTITPNPLEMHADSVDVAIKVDFPAKCFCKKAKVEATPVLRYEGGEKELKKETRQGEGVQENNKVIKYADGGSINYTDKFAFDEA
ncbi:MAG: hypothetical protein HY738_22315 [Bacteroidia bacterium]|nr:hypothetical protein [Bacteroidia bacterium]